MNIKEFRNKYHYDTATKMMQQYLDIKFAHLDCLLLFRMGDFYELFYDDAIVSSAILGITLTKRGKNGELEIPMCGVPYHALEHYLPKLVAENFKIAICDQLETPEEAKKRDGHKAVVIRCVTRIITPGTVIEESLIATSEPNFLASLVISKNRNIAAICCIDISTSEIFTINIPVNEILNELARLKPKEILLSENLRSTEIVNNIVKQFCGRITYQVDSFFAENKCRKIILDFYKIRDILAIGELSGSQISAIGSVLEYISLTQKQHIPQLPLPRVVNYRAYMTIDLATRRSLEIVSNLLGQMKGSLLDTIDHTVTKQGSRLLYYFLSSPLTDIAQINHRLNITDFFFSNLEMVKKIREILKNTSDLERSLTRITMNRGSGRDLLSIKYTLDAALLIQEVLLVHYGITLPPCIEKMLKPLSGDDELYELIHSAIRDDAPNHLNDGGVINPAYHARIAALYDLIDNVNAHIEKLKEQYRDETEIDNLKISHNNILGFFIEITSKNLSKITDAKFIHRQTTANSVRYTTLELQKLESDLVNARILAVNLEKEIYANICQQVIEKSNFIRILSSALSGLDVFCNFAYIAGEYGYVRPELLHDLTFEITEGRHPVIEKVLNKSGQGFVNNNCLLSEDKRVWLITGPNMAGKSTFLRQNALIAIMAQIGCFVPAKQAKIGVIDKIFSRIGAADDLLKGHSTFMAEMLETSAILAQSTHRSLIILDELGRGTSTYDGVSIAWAVLEHIHDKLKCRCLFATHYHELTVMDKFLPALQNHTISIEELAQGILFLYKIVEGIADRSYGIHVASIAGLPSSVVSRANQVLAKFESTSARRSGNMLPSESSNFNLCAMQHVITEKKITQLEQEIMSIDPDLLSPIEALEVVYKLKQMV